MQSTTVLGPMDCINKSGLIKGSEVFWLILPSQIVIRLILRYKTLITLVLIQQCFATWFKPNNALLHSMVLYMDHCSPQQLRPVIIQQYHGQHQSEVNKTYRRIKLKWFWPEMTSQIRTSVRRCVICQAAKHSNPNKKEYQQRLFAGRP